MNKISEGWKGIIALLGALVTGLLGVATVLQTDPNVTAATDGASIGWGATVVAVAGLITGVIAVLKRNSLQVDQIRAGLEAGDVSLSDLRRVFDEFKHKVGDNTPPLGG